MQIINLNILNPLVVTNHDDLPLWDEFFLPLYSRIYDKLDDTTTQYPHVDFDDLKPEISQLIEGLQAEQINLIRNKGKIGIGDWNRARENKSLMVLLNSFPALGNLLTNIHLLSKVAIKSCEACIESSIDTSNFIAAKQFIDQMNNQRWTRAQTTSEQQSGVSNLGSMSELLLEIAMSSLIDDRNFFKTQNNKIQSYGDFVLMCLPNNLWLSVKSNFARERLLASGYTTDILGVGFFTSKDEFTSRAKIRNFQRVGFLAMYLPDVPVSPSQVAAGENTFDEVEKHYRDNSMSLPININGTPFLRRLSTLNSDISNILNITDIRNRTTLGF